MAWLDALAAIAGDAGLRQFADNPKVTRRAGASASSPASPARRCRPQAQNFLRAVIDNGRLAALPEIATQFRALVNAAGGSSDAHGRTAPSRSTPTQLADLAEALEKRFGRKLQGHGRRSTRR